MWLQWTKPSNLILTKTSFLLFFQICTKARMWRVCVCCDLDSSWTKQRGNCGRISSEAIYGKDPQFLSSYSLRGRRSKGRGEEDTVSGIGGWRKKTIPSDIFWSCFSPPPLFFTFSFVHFFRLFASSPCWISKPYPSCANSDFEKVVT